MKCKRQVRANVMRGLGTEQERCWVGDGEMIIWGCLNINILHILLIEQRKIKKVRKIRFVCRKRY